MTPNLYRLPYYAGLIDGDGYIGMMRVGSAATVPTIALGMTHKETIEEFSKFFDITCVAITSPAVIKLQEERGHKKQWRARTCSHQAYNIIKKIQPWLLEKSDAALECCGYYEGRVCELCGGDIPTDRPGKSAKYCSVKCYNTADRRRRKAFRNNEPWNPIIESKEVIKPERVFSCEEEKLSYYGGILDAEGHFGIHSTHYGSGFKTMFQLKACHEPMMKEFSELCGLPYTPLMAPSHIKMQEEKGHQQAYVIQSQSTDWNYEFCKKILPYLHTKKTDAEALMEYTQKKRGG